MIWNINGTNGASDDESWDRCAEVGAAEALVTVDGTSTSVPCEAGGRMAATIGSLKLGAHQVAVKLRNADRADLTTEASAVVRTGTRGGVLIADFFHDSFLDGAAIRGDLIFRTTFEGQLCTATRPPVALQITLLRLNGQAVENAQVCAASGEGVSLCTAVDDRTPRACSAGAQRIANLPLGPLQAQAARRCQRWLRQPGGLLAAGARRARRRRDQQPGDHARRRPQLQHRGLRARNVAQLPSAKNASIHGPQCAAITDGV
ncbi:MAG: hypothetical protein IPG96_06245 [Proteobacteria bacterium]|nr:hypothetical protein [Pseudomonadota bacterium]